MALMKQWDGAAWVDVAAQEGVPAIQDTPVNGATTAGISSNWAYDHAASTSAHGMGSAAQASTGDFATAAQGTKADTALKPADVVDALNSTSAVLPLSANQGKALNDSKLAASGGTIGTYAETGATLTPVAGVLTIPLDGRHYSCTPDADITSIVPSNVPTAPLVGAATVYFNYSSAARAIASPTSWYWTDKIRSLSATKSGYIVRLDVWSTPAGNICAATMDMGVPA